MKTRMSTAIFLVILGNAAQVLASFPNVATVVQPVEVDGPGLLTMLVSYVGYQFDWQDPGSEIMLTTQPNSVSHDGQPRDINYAVQQGIQFSRPSAKARARSTGWPGIHGDTLDVTVDLTSFKQHAGSEEFDQLVVTTTLYCGLRNAKCHWPTVRYVNYSIVGNGTFANYSGIYPLEHLKPPEQTAQPELKEVGPEWLRGGSR
jgi:hypothetical protein